MATDYMDDPDDQQDRVRYADEPAHAQDDDAVQGDVATLPRSFCPDMDLNPGTTFRVRVEKVFEDELLVSYVRGKGDTDEAVEPPSDESDPLMD
jgi:hypothetical protein